MCAAKMFTDMCDVIEVVNVIFKAPVQGNEHSGVPW